MEFVFLQGMYEPCPPTAGDGASLPGYFESSHTSDLGVATVVTTLPDSWWCRPPRWPSGQGVHLESARLGFDSCFRRESFSRSSHTSDFKIGTPVATLPGAWRCRVSAGTGWPDGQ